MLGYQHIRRVDDLGRVVIPKEVRRFCGIREGDPMDVVVNEYTKDIIIRKHINEVN